jgi:uncharacterized protein YecA (UPF0149 family)
MRSETEDYSQSSHSGSCNEVAASSPQAALLSEQNAALGTPEPIHLEASLGRNDPCNCGSGKKYKKCHGA